MYNIPRRKVVLMTKCYRVVSDEEAYDPGLGVTMHHETADRSKDYVNQWVNFSSDDLVTAQLMLSGAFTSSDLHRRASIVRAAPDKLH